MSHCIWYVSKYVAPPGAGSHGGRGFLLMKELVRMGNRSVIIGSDSNLLAQVPNLDRPYVHESIDGVELWWVRTLKYDLAKSFRRILSWLHFEWRLLLMPKKNIPRPDVVIVSSPSLLTILSGFLLRRKYGCRLVFEIRDIWPLTFVEEGGFKPGNPFIRAQAFIERLGYRHSDIIVGTMPNLGEHVRHVLGYERQVSCIPMGVDEQVSLESMPLPESFVQKYIPQDKFVVAYTGTMGITNALDTFLDCAESMKDRSNIHFLLVGDGGLREFYKEKYGHLHNVTFAPKVRKEMVLSILDKCNLLYFSTHASEVWRYGQSLNKLIDYMLSGKPVLASYTGYPSMINEARSGRFVPAGDIEALREAVIEIAAMDSVELDAMGKRGREWILKHRNYHSLANAYQAVMFPP